jgi:hypothetical protein
LEAPRTLFKSRKKSDASRLAPARSPHPAVLMLIAAKFHGLAGPKAGSPSIGGPCRLEFELEFYLVLPIAAPMNPLSFSSTDEDFEMKTHLKNLSFAAALLTVFNVAVANADDDKAPARVEFEQQAIPAMPYTVTHADWTAGDEAQYDKFVTQIGSAIAAHKCNTVKKCMRDPKINLYAAKDPAGAFFYADCAEFPYLLRAYFAYQNHLPFSYANNTRMNMKPVASMNDHDAELPNKNPANGPYGNTIISRSAPNVAALLGQEPNLVSYIVNMYDNVSTRMFRTSALSENYGTLADLYPVKIDRNGIRAGTMVHSTGHVMIVWNVDENGGINVFDGHPDGTVQSKKIQAANLDRARPDQNLGFLRFRPLHLKGATKAPNGELLGGQVVTESDQTLLAQGKYSLEQWFGPGSQVFPGQTVEPNAWKHAFAGIGFFDFLASRLRGSNVVVNVVDAVADQMNSVCLSIQDRVGAVEQATLAGVQALPHPEALPQDVYGEEEQKVWAPFSTPGRDGVLRAATQDVIKSAVAQFKRAKAGARDLSFTGSASDYAKALVGRVKAFDQSCKITFKGSAGQPVTVGYSVLLANLGKMSFDPYDCPEKRWGVIGQPGMSCHDGDTQNVWYSAETNMRNTVGKLTINEVQVMRSDRAITLEMLGDASLIDRPDNEAVSLGTSNAPITDLLKTFGSQAFLNQLTK